MNNIQIIHLEDIPVNYAAELAQILNTDIKLQNALSSNRKRVTGNELV